MRKFNAIWLLLSSVLFAQTEILVNTEIDTTQRDPQIARDSGSNYVIVWDSENQVSANSKSDIYFQLFDSNNDKVGEETLVNEITVNEQERPALDMNGEGSFIVVWASHTEVFESIFDIKGRLYKENIPVGGEFLINTATANSQTKPEVSMHADGSLLLSGNLGIKLNLKISLCKDMMLTETSLAKKH